MPRLKNSKSWKPLRPWGLALFESGAANYAADGESENVETAQAMGISTFEFSSVGRAEDQGSKNLETAQAMGIDTF